jgi:EAL domain-containing protein (putative c-di-GMP-specific phosphodiesterase class I)
MGVPLIDPQALDLGSRIRSQLVADLKEGKFLLYFQSIVPAAHAASEPLYREILVRFREEEQDMMPPGMFFPVLEQNGLMPLLDRWVVAQVIKWVRNTPANPSRPPPRCSINLATDTIRRDTALVEFILEGIRKTAISGASLSFEIPLAELLAAPRSLARLMPDLRAMGCTFALTGFSGEEPGFELARSLGFSFVKVDGSLAYRVARDPLARASILAIVQRCRNLGMRTVCTQVEGTETLDTLRGLRVDYVQGFGIDRPRLLK